MSMRDDDDDLTTEELLSMWQEGEPVAIVSTRLDLKNVPWAREFGSSSRGILSETGPTIRPGEALLPHPPTIQESNIEEAFAQTA
ncbi:MAG: hypothetical protein L0206_18890 [Actinobacteria bacterium]|nr:hypothetical protein [Actinomycetota bacterium]